MYRGKKTIKNSLFSQHKRGLVVNIKFDCLINCFLSKVTTMTESLNFYCDGILGMPAAPRIITSSAAAPFHYWYRILAWNHIRFSGRGRFPVDILLNGNGTAHSNGLSFTARHLTNRIECYVK